MKNLLLITIALIGMKMCVNAQAISTMSSSRSSYLLCGIPDSPKVCGHNDKGQLGIGTTNNSSTPAQIGLSDITAIAGGKQHSLFLKNDGSVWSCGFNEYGQLGDGTTTDRLIPVEVIGLSGIIAIAAGGYHSIFLKNDGSVWSCGFNGQGQLGDGTTTDRNTPVAVSGLSDITSIAGGWVHSIFLKNDSSTWACGDNSQGQLGDGTTANRNTPVAVIGISGITAIAAGDHSLFLKNDSHVWTCGNNSQGQLGDGTTTNRNTPVEVSGLSGVTMIAAGNHHSLFLKNDGNVWACGLNYSGQLGDGTTTNRHTPVVVSDLSEITTIAGGWVHSLFLKSDGSTWSCGNNEYGQLGDGSFINKHTPVLVISNATVTSDNSALICSGENLNITLTGGNTPLGVFNWVAEDNTNTTGESISVQASNTINDLINNNTESNQIVVYSVTAFGCIGAGLAQTVTITVKPLPIVTVGTAGNILSADAVNASYQWLDCDDNNIPLESEINQDFTATQNGNYSVIVTQNSCSDTSLCINVNSVGLDYSYIEDGLTVYPNPTNGDIWIELLSAWKCSKIEVYNDIGKLIKSTLRKSAQSINLQLPGSNGIYFIRLVGVDGNVLHVKVVKK